MNRSEKNVIRDSHGCVHLGGGRTLKHLFGKRGAGSQQFAKSIHINVLYIHTCVSMYVCMHMYVYVCVYVLCMHDVYIYVTMYMYNICIIIIVWQVISLVQKLILEDKTVTQREAYYCLVQYFKNQREFNDVLQGNECMLLHCLSLLFVVVVVCSDVVVLTGVARASLGICATSSGAISGLLLWKVLN